MTLFTDTVALFIDKELDIINVINIFAASGIDLQELIARSVVTENLATPAQIDVADSGYRKFLTRQRNQQFIFQQTKR